MPDTEGFNLITNGATLVVGVDAFQIGTIPSGTGAGNPIFASIVGLRVNGAPVATGNALPVADATALTALAAISSNTNGAATAAAQATGNASLTTISNAQGAQGTGLNPPTGGSGILGFLSGIYNKLSSSLSIIGAVTSNDGGSAGTGISQPAGGSGLSGWLSGIYAALAAVLQTKAAALTSVALDNSTVTTAGTAIVALNAGHATAGGFIRTVNAAGMFVAQIGNAGTVDGGNTVFVPANVTYDVIPSPGSVTVNSTVSGLVLSGYGQQ